MSDPYRELIEQEDLEDVIEEVSGPEEEGDASNTDDFQKTPQKAAPNAIIEEDPVVSIKQRISMQEDSFALPEDEEEEIEEEAPASSEDVFELEEELAAPIEEIKEVIFEEPKEEVSMPEEQQQVSIKESLPEIQEEPIVIEEKVEEVKEPEVSFKELKKVLWKKVNPYNQTRFQELNIEETPKNKSKLDDFAAKITIVADDLEDGDINEEDAILALKGIEQKLDSF